MTAFNVHSSGLRQINPVITQNTPANASMAMFKG